MSDDQRAEVTVAVVDRTWTVACSCGYVMEGESWVESHVPLDVERCRTDHLHLVHGLSDEQPASDRSPIGPERTGDA